jgi:hypothetical protein
MISLFFSSSNFLSNVYLSTIMCGWQWWRHPCGSPFFCLDQMEKVWTSYKHHIYIYIPKYLSQKGSDIYRAVKIFRVINFQLLKIKTISTPTHIHAHTQEQYAKNPFNIVFLKSEAHPNINSCSQFKEWI